jgi:hypothetical protein
MRSRRIPRYASTILGKSLRCKGVKRVMIVKKLILGIIVMIALVRGECSMPEKQSISEGKCLLDYQFFNPSLGPVYGERKFRIFLENGIVEKIVDRRTEEEADLSLGIPGLRILLDVLKGNLKGKGGNLQCFYNPQGELVALEQKGKSGNVGGSFRIEIISISCQKHY